ncbi:MAG: hypothetical protein QW517_10140 [Thermofilaceae archaeon]
MGHRKGPVVKCPLCGAEGRETVIKVKAKGHVYFYKAVVHLNGRKCTLERVEPPPEEEERERLRQLVKKLEGENRELLEQLARAEARATAAETRAAALNRLLHGAVWLRERELAALEAVFVKERGYTEEQLKIAREIMYTIIARGLQNGLAVVCFPPAPQ